MLSWSERISLIVSVGLIGSSLLAQEPHPLLAKLEGQWAVDESQAHSDPIDRTPFFAVAETYLTPAGLSFREAYGNEANDPATSCPMAGTLADQPVDFELIDRGSFIDIVSYGRTRRVFMDFEREPPETFVPNALGWSVGHWVGDMLVIRTTRLSEGAVRLGERPLPFGGPIAQIVERYTLSEDRNRLSVTINLNDPKFYAYSLRVRHYYARADNILRGRDCVPASAAGPVG